MRTFVLQRTIVKKARRRKRDLEGELVREKERGGVQTGKALITDRLGHYQSMETLYETITNGEHQSARR